MSRKKAVSLAKLERELFMHGLYENVYAARRRPGKPSVRAILHDAERVELVGSNAKALDGVYNALTSGKAEVSATKLRAISEDEVLRALEPSEREATGKLLKR